MGSNSAAGVDHWSLRGTCVRVSDDQLPGAVGLTPQHLNRSGAKLDRVARGIDRRAVKVGVERRQIIYRHYPAHLALEFCLCLDKSGNHLANPLAAEKRFAGRSDKSGVRFIQLHDPIKITGVEVLHKNTGPIVGVPW
jgi:hypothetical protein